MNIQVSTLIGDKVKLRPINFEKDHLAWFEVSQDENMHIWVGNIAPKSYDEVKDLLYELYPKYFLIWMIEELESHKIIGMMRISYPEYQDGELAAGDSQRLHSDYWRKGHMKESRRLIYDYVFNELKVDALYADVWEGNINSCKSLESVGYRLVEKKPEFFEKYNRVQNKIYYQLKSSWWKESKSKGVEI